MGMGGGSSRDKLQSEINVTPLVDVCLVLLIIFMVVTPLLQKGIPVTLPTTDKPDKKPENANQKVITVAYGTPPILYVEADRLSKEEFQRRIDEMYQRAPQTELVVKADKRLKYGDVKEVMKMTKEPGFQNVGLIAEKKPQGIAPAAR
jgi:biopolymer transport protein TolR